MLLQYFILYIDDIAEATVFHLLRTSVIEASTEETYL